MQSPYQQIKIPQVEDLEERFDDVDETITEAIQRASDTAMLWSIVLGTSN